MKMKIGKILACAVLAFSMSFSMIGCGSSAAGVVVGITEEVDSMNPLVAENMVSFEVFSLIYDPLIKFDENYDAVPCLAESWETNEDGTEWTFHLADAAWHDGEPVVAEDVKLTYELMESSYLYGTYATDIDEIKCPDDKTVILKCEKPKVNLLRSTIPILPAHIWAELGEDGAYEYANDDCIGSGPYVFAGKDDTTINLTLNENYFAEGGKVPSYSFILYKSQDGLASALKTGEVAGATSLGATQLKAMAKEDGISIIEGSVNGWTNVFINVSDSEGSTGHPLLKEKSVRQAIEYCTDKEAIIEKAYGGVGIVADTIVPITDTQYHYTPEKTRKYDVDEANALLDAAGYVDSDNDGIREANGKPIEFRMAAVADNTEEVKAAQIIAGGCEKAGIKIKFETMDSGKMWDDAWEFNYDMMISGYGGDLDPSTILGVFASSFYAEWDGTNDFGYVSAAYDNLYAKQGTIVDEAERAEVINQMQQIVYEDAPAIMLLYDSYVQAVRTDVVTGFEQIPEGGSYFFNSTIVNYLNAEMAAEE